MPPSYTSLCAHRHIYIGTTASLGSCAITVVTGWLYLDDPVLSIIPVTIVCALLSPFANCHCLGRPKSHFAVFHQLVECCWLLLDSGTQRTSPCYTDYEFLTHFLCAQVIFFGFFLCFLVVAVLRYRAALALRKSPRLLLSQLCLKIRDHKVSRSVPQSRYPSTANILGGASATLGSSVMEEQQAEEENKPSESEPSTMVTDYIVSVPISSLPP